MTHAEKKKEPSVVQGYVTLAQLEERWRKEQERKRKEEEDAAKLELNQRARDQERKGQDQTRMVPPSGRLRRQGTHTLKSGENIVSWNKKSKEEKLDGEKDGNHAKNPSGNKEEKSGDDRRPSIDSSGKDHQRSLLRQRKSKKKSTQSNGRRREEPVEVPKTAAIVVSQKNGFKNVTGEEIHPTADIEAKLEGLTVDESRRNGEKSKYDSRYTRVRKFPHHRWDRQTEEPVEVSKTAVIVVSPRNGFENVAVEENLPTAAIEAKLEGLTVDESRRNGEKSKYDSRYTRVRKFPHHRWDRQTEEPVEVPKTAAIVVSPRNGFENVAAEEIHPTADNEAKLEGLTVDESRRNGENSKYDSRYTSVRKFPRHRWSRHEYNFHHEHRRQDKIYGCRWVKKVSNAVASGISGGEKRWEEIGEKHA